MSSLLERLYSGEIYPAAQIRPGGEEYRSVSRRISDEMDSWKADFGADQYRRLEELCDLFMRSNNLELCETFRWGVSIGAAFAAEVRAVLEESGE